MQIEPIDLIKKFFELKNLSKCKQWSEENFKNNEPRLYRYQQLKALFHAYNISFNIKRFRKGNFIENKDIKYEEFIKYIGTEIKRFYDGESLDKAWIQLFNYYATLQKSLSYTDGVLLSSGAYSFINRKINQNNKDIRKNWKRLKMY